ncbi:conserved hypothetical protein [Sporisorium reilianum SRZ2]|uniref:Uncharacterized protein n=1 Tax=Sporisorium reilianum (strain SRZ2) TaxID=999809 RepID=E6ZWH3_SPORE|nr:conserved hypothetical protein [Sporisorium reilianum SRZ2]
MSLRFLTRRRDRDRSHSSTPSGTDTCLVLPPADSLLRRGKPALVPSEVQIISWHPTDLQASGREVHISSRAHPAAVAPATPVYNAFTARSLSAHLSSAHVSADGQGDTRAHTSGSSDIGHTFFSARDAPSHRSYDSHRARAKTEPHSQPATWPEAALAESTSATPRAPSAADTPRSEDVEELSSSLGALPALEPEPNPTPSVPIRLTSKARRAKARSHHAHSSYTGAFDDAVPSFTGTPASLPSSSGLGFSLLHRNASVPSFDFVHAGGAHGQSAGKSEAGTLSGLLSRIASTRQLRRTKHAAGARVDAAALAHWSEAEGTSDARARSHSITSKLRRSREGKPTRSAAPPSAWRTEAADASSAYSSDTEHSVAPGSSSGHAAEPAGGARHAMNASWSDVAAAASSVDGAASKRFSSAAVSPAGQVHANGVGAQLDSPQVSGLPLPLAHTAEERAIETTHLLRRLGPPPVGLAPECFEDRVALIQNYVLNQLPLPLLPRSHSPADDSTGYTGYSSRSGSASSQHAHRSSLPPPSRQASTRNSSSMSASTQATLQDEFAKLECVAEHALVLHGALATHAVLQQLRLQDAFVEARRRCGVDWSKSHFELGVARGGVDAGRGGAGAGLGLRGVDEGSEMSLRPAPRRRRGAAGRPITAPASATSLLPPAHASATDAIGFDSALFTPQSFSAKRKPSPVTTRPPSSNDTHSSTSHTTHRSTSSSSAAAVRSPPLFGHDLSIGAMAADRRSQDTQFTDSDCCVGDGTGRAKAGVIEW